MQNHDGYNNDQNQNYGYPSSPAQPASYQRTDNRGKAITSMVLGIISICICWYPFITSIPCLIIGIVAVALSSSARQNLLPQHMGMATAGKVTGIIGIILSALMTLAGIFVFNSLSNVNYYY